MPNSKRPEPSSHTAAGTGTALTALMPFGPKLRCKVRPLPKVDRMKFAKLPSKLPTCRKSRTSMAPGVKLLRKSIAKVPPRVNVPRTFL